MESRLVRVPNLLEDVGAENTWAFPVQALTKQKSSGEENGPQQSPNQHEIRLTGIMPEIIMEI